ncbi:MAG: Biotin-lipoyl like, partial [Actinomycetota bacterium]|nr:Biotin-lipoyl like [Actinomycetota bacterium]
MPRWKRTVWVAGVVVAVAGSSLALRSAQAIATSNVVSVGLNFKTGGLLKDVLVEAGQLVVKGQVLAREDPADAQIALRVAQADLA